MFRVFQGIGADIKNVKSLKSDNRVHIQQAKWTRAKRKEKRNAFAHGRFCETKQ